jgi:hypothetical protein
VRPGSQVLALVLHQLALKSARQLQAPYEHVARVVSFRVAVVWVGLITGSKSKYPSPTASAV